MQLAHPLAPVRDRLTDRKPGSTRPESSLVQLRDPLPTARQLPL